jgi:hypothetical protein
MATRLEELEVIETAAEMEWLAAHTAHMLAEGRLRVAWTDWLIKRADYLKAKMESKAGAALSTPGTQTEQEKG